MVVMHTYIYVYIHPSNSGSPVTAEDMERSPLHDKEVVGEQVFLLLDTFIGIGSWTAMRSPSMKDIPVPPSKDLTFLKGADPELSRICAEVDVAAMKLQSSQSGTETLSSVVASLSELSKKLDDRKCVVYTELSKKHKVDMERYLKRYYEVFISDAKGLYSAFVNLLSGAIEVSEGVYVFMHDGTS